MRIPSGVTDQYIYFVAVDSTDFTTRETGLSSFTVYRSRNGAAAAAMTTPTINETDATNMPGVYELLLDEDMTIGAGNDSEEMAFHITATGMAPVTRTIELYRPKITAGNTLDVTATGAGGIDWGNIENAGTTVDLSATTIDSCDDVTGAVGSVTGAVGSVTGSVGSVTAAVTVGTINTNTITAASIAASALDGKGDWNVGKTGYSLTQTFPSNFADLAITVTTGQVTVGTNNDKTGYTASTVSDKTGYSLTQAFPTNFADLSITATTGRIDVGSWLGTAVTLGNSKPDVNVDSWNDTTVTTALETASDIRSITTGTADSGTTTTLVDAARTEADTDYWKGALLLITSGNIAGQVRQISAFTPGTDTITVDRAFTQAVSTNTYEILSTGYVDTTVVDGIQSDLDNGTDGLGAIKTDTAAILDDTGTAGVLVSDGTGAGQIALTAGAVDTVTSVTNQVTADVTAISGDATAADRLEALMDGSLVCQVNDASATTTAFAADGFTEATDDHFNGRLITFISGALSGQQTDITDYDAAGGAQGSQQFTVTALTEAPANNDFFVIH